MNTQIQFVLQRLGLIVLTALPMQVAGEDLSGFGQPSLVLSDQSGLPFYPTDTHVFTPNATDASVMSFGRIMTVTADTTTAAPVHSLSQSRSKPEAAVALRATVLRRSELLVQQRAPLRARAVQSVPRAVPSSDIGDSWSVGVFR
ncbi:hypothetical protein SAMN04488515_2662 [Cognatiyoonia koreensis]|uniref:Uncharacterized protein n=1 Tax=Cognatiyoonia koreensis TaxID=364200 RepID=A0A1I0RGW3_9RHOB|nr:hypothetical protein [Cognatiyoonia koreensis]SEW40072.1 hypothetical protein SAMN04488515_2662 [Cognatiyoonia koreensis]